MANSIHSNPIVLDTFTSDIDLGAELFNDSKTVFYLNSIEWANPTAVNDTAKVIDADGNVIFNETCTVAKQSIIKYFFKAPVRGIKIGAGEVSSGKIIIFIE